MLPIHLIVNPRSGYGRQQQLLPGLRAELKQSGYRLIEYTTKAPEDATRYAAENLRQDVLAVIVAGGDGTISEVVNGLVGSDTPMLPFPVGTENLLAKELKISANPARVARIISDRKIVTCDVGRINGRNFLLIIGVGFDGEVVRRLVNIRTGHISHLSYFWPIWRTFWGHDFPQMRIIADGQEIFNDRGMAFVGNISRYAAGLRICRDARFDDGLLDLVIFGCRAKGSLVLHAAWTLLRMHPQKGDVICRQFKKLRIESTQATPSQVDGDVGPTTPLDIEVLDQRVNLLVPRQVNQWLWPWKGLPI